MKISKPTYNNSDSHPILPKSKEISLHLIKISERISKNTFKLIPLDLKTVNQ